MFANLNIPSFGKLSKKYARVVSSNNLYFSVFILIYGPRGSMMY